MASTTTTTATAKMTLSVFIADVLTVGRKLLLDSERSPSREG
jgi:hypothetical protein